MFYSTALSIVIGLVFIYLLYSLLVTILQEILATIFDFRAKVLERALRRMLNDDQQFEYRLSSVIRLFLRSEKRRKPGNLFEAFYHHPLVRFLSAGSIWSKPSYLRKETFSKVMLDLLKGKQVQPGDDLRSPIQRMLDGEQTDRAALVMPENSDTLSFLRSIWADAQGDVDKFRSLLENWFDEMMDRASEWYKKYTQFFLLAIGFSIAVVFNVDTIAIVGKLEKDPELREQLVTQAENFLKAHPDLEQEFQLSRERHATLFPDDALERKKQDSLAEQRYLLLKQRRDSLVDQANTLVREDIGKVNNLLSIGRDSNRCLCACSFCFLKSLTGWLLTALALSLGAPFWFDLLSKLMKLRSSTQAGSGKNTNDPAATDTATKIERKG